MRLQSQKVQSVKVSVQPHPYVKGESKGKNKSVNLLETEVEEVFDFILACLENHDAIAEKLEEIAAE